MNIILKIEMITLALLMLIFIFITLKKKNVNIKYSVLWFLLPVLYLIFAIFPQLMTNLANRLGFEVLSNMIFFLTIGVLMIICFSLTVIVSNLKSRVNILTQEISMIRSDLKK